jgi:hypothetical protein
MFFAMVEFLNGYRFTFDLADARTDKVGSTICALERNEPVPDGKKPVRELRGTHMRDSRDIRYYRLWR